jgi:hypothetical protein
VSVRVRIDDYPTTNDSERWRHNIDSFKRFRDILPKRPLLAIIPMKTSEEDMQQLSLLDVHPALHGWNHDERFRNEFPPFLTDADVLSRLKGGKDLIEQEFGIPIVDYVPPHNVIDRRTCEALASLGFERVYGGPGMDESQVSRLELVMSFFPKEYGRSDELMQRGAVEHLNSIEDATLTLHWTWETNIGLDSLKSFMRSIERRVVDFG